MKIADLKTAIAADAGINLPTLMLVRQKDQNTDAPQPWLSHWDNDKRVRISLHEDVAKKVQEDANYDGLAYKKEEVVETSERKAYTRYIIINPTSVEMRF